MAAGAVARGTAIGNTAAEDIALRDAGTDISQARVYYTQFDFEDGHYVYDVEFTANGMEYDYRIKASDGKILGRSSEPMEGYAADMSQNTGLNTAQPQAASAGDQTSGQNAVVTTISADEAKRIALDHAGLSDSSVKFTKAYLEYDDGMEQYEIEFYEGTTEYDYAIDAVNGTVLGYSMESIFS